MGRRLLLLTFTLIGCSGSMSQTCPDGEPIYILRNIEDAYPAYVREYDASLSAAEKAVSGAEVGATIKTKAVRLREELDQANIAIQEQYKTVVIALQMTPCDKEVRNKAMDFLVDIKSQTKRIPDRMKELNDQAVAKLHSEVSNLLRYPDASKDTAKPPTVTEKLLVDQLPRRLFDLLYGYSDESILHLPKIGAALLDHKNAYYSFRQRVTKLEGSLMARVEKAVQVRFREGWQIYLQYLVMRFGGNSKEQIVSGGNFLNYDITWDDCERVFRELSADQSLTNTLSETFASHKALVHGINQIALAI